MPQTQELSVILDRWANGERDALDQLMPAVYKDLRRLARYHLDGERQGHTLQPSALVHETFLRFGNYEQIAWQDRAHFFAVASTIMRRVLVDHARKRAAAKRGAAATVVTLVESQSPGKSADVDIEALDEALTRLEALDARQHRVVEMRFFGGLSHREIAEMLGLSMATVNRDWRVAKLWLRRALAEGSSSDY